MTAPLLRLLAVTKSFGAVRALKSVSFDLQPAEVHALLGENGAGKSTLIKVITGAHPPDSGAIEIDGHAVGSLTPATAHKLGIACIYQQPALFPDLTVEENLGLRLEPISPRRVVNWPERRARACGLLDRIGAAISPETEVRQLSMPEQQLVEIACAIGAGARILIMDEPTSSLTDKEQQILFGLINDLRARGTGIIYISHRLDEIFQLANRVTVLRDGETVATRNVQRSSTGHSGRAELPLRPDLGGAAASPYPTEQLTETELIKLMVGREVSTIYPPSESAPGVPLLSLKEVGCATSGIHNVTFDVHAGEVFCLAGLVGAGRTELARVLFGLTPADAGEISIAGAGVVIRSPRDATGASIAYVPEDRRSHGVILEMPLAHNTTMAAHRRLFPGRWLRLMREQLLARKYIHDLDVRTSGPDALVNSLSGGNQQKISLARWLATEPKVLILDEPTQGVDVGAKSELHRIIRRLALEGVAVLLISSDLPEVLGMGDRIGVMRRGTLATILPGRSDPHEVMAAAIA